MKVHLHKLNTPEVHCYPIERNTGSKIWIGVQFSVFYYRLAFIWGNKKPNPPGFVPHSWEFFSVWWILTIDLLFKTLVCVAGCTAILALYHLVF